MNITQIEYEVDKVRYVLVVLLLLIGLCSAQGPFSGGTVILPGTTQPQDIYIISRTEYTLDDTRLNAPGVAILLSAWQSGTPNDVEVPGVNIYITGGPTDRVARTDGYGYIFVKWPFSKNDEDKSWSLHFSPDPNNPYAPGSAHTTVSSYIPEDKSSFTKLSVILSQYVYTDMYLTELPKKP